jgi:MoaA/NifB/PqqE/SkfB family radical SAM enzyme
MSVPGGSFILKGYDISEEESYSCAQNYVNSFETKQKSSQNLVPMIALFCPNRCNLDCIFCSSSVNTPPYDALSKNFLERIIFEAAQVGVRTIEIAAMGEPTLWEDILFLSELTNRYGMTLVIFTNGMIFSDEDLCMAIHHINGNRFVETLYENNVSIIVKRNSNRKNTYDKLAGLNGAYNGSALAFKKLIKIGFASSFSTRLGLSCVITKHNYKDVPELWYWARDNNIFPFVESLQRIGRASDDLYCSLEVSEQKILEMYAKFAEYDKVNFGFLWKPQLPYAGFSCSVYDHVAINNKGLISPCFKFFLEEHICGDLNKSSLLEILLSSNFLYEIRKQRLMNQIGAICINRVPLDYLNNNE